MSLLRALPLAILVLLGSPVSNASAVVYPFESVTDAAVAMTLRARQGNVLVTVGPFAEVPVNPLVDDLDVTLPPGVAISGELLLGLSAADQSLVFMDAIGVPPAPVTLTLDRIDLRWPKAGDVWKVQLGAPVPSHPTLAYDIEGTLQVGSTIEPFSFVATCGGATCLSDALVEVTGTEATVSRRFQGGKASYRSTVFDLGTIEAVDFEMNFTFSWDEIRFAPEPAAGAALAALFSLAGLARFRHEP